LMGGDIVNRGIFHAIVEKAPELLCDPAPHFRLSDVSEVG